MANPSVDIFIPLLKILHAWSMCRGLRAFRRPSGKEGDCDEQRNLFYIGIGQ